MVAGNSSGTEFANNSFLFLNPYSAQAVGERHAEGTNEHYRYHRPDL